MRATARAAGRDPASIEVTTGLPAALLKPGNDPLAAIADAKKRGIGRIALPVNAFMPDLEANLEAYGETVIRQLG
jgi:hypothetical protein